MFILVISILKSWTFYVQKFSLDQKFNTKLNHNIKKSVSYFLKKNVVSCCENMYLMSWLSDKNNCYLKEQCIRWILGFFLSMSRYCLSCACSYYKYVCVVLICCSLYDFFQSNLSLKYTIKIFVKYTYLNTCSITSLLYLINQKPI